MSRKRFIYKKVVTGYPVPVLTWYLPTVGPRERLTQTHRLPQGIFVSGRPPDPETITVDKWIASIVGPRRPRLRRIFEAFSIDANFSATPGAQPDIVLDRWYRPVIQPRRRARTLAAPYIQAGMFDSTPIVPSQPSTGVYKLKIRSDSRKTEL